MVNITASMVANLRAKTGMGMMECKKALVEVEGDMMGAEDILRIKSGSKASKLASRRATEGIVVLCINQQLGVLVEVNCETDFVGRSEAFRKFAHEVALQIAASFPLYIREEDIPAAVIQHEEAIATAKAKEEGKADNLLPRIVEGSIKKYKNEMVLLRQVYIRDENLTIEQLLNQTIAATGENIVIRRFVRYGLGEVNSAE